MTRKILCATDGADHSAIAIIQAAELADRYGPPPAPVRNLLQLAGVRAQATAVGLTDEARRTAAVLGYNFPGSDWYADAYKLVGGGSSAGADLF